MPDNTPVIQLQALGLGRPPWADSEEQTGENQWTYRSGFLSPRGVRDLGFLLVNGWDVSVHARSSQITIRARRKEQP
ncbi:hypothetical protein GCM10022219_11610 [Microbacterium oryzae]|uniref:Uncharacterized protein n=1 Tax=Microbacterium oryzae TaxID=743009 RepID=A0A6I6E3F7_9MICO|nr:hypothetical protein [Microbacterium oryzae]QGU28469.1 hypothetical protein D7D94_12905 [Microbacterium oryzae]